MVTLSYVFFIFVTLSGFYNLYDEIVVNYFAHAHTRYTRPPFAQGIPGRLSLCGLESRLPGGRSTHMSHTDKQTRALKCKPSAGDLIIKKPEE